ncbi:MAG: hypothetical protein AABZ30_01690, partial [Myxococcota bacterium]
GMWGEMKIVSSRINTTNERLDRLDTNLNARIDATNERLDDLRGDVNNLRGDVQTLGRRIDNVLLGAHGDEHAELRARVERLERRAPVVSRRTSPRRGRS